MTRGPAADRIRAALDKRVKLGEKGADVSFDDALQAFKKDAGLDVTVRVMQSTRTAVPVERPRSERRTSGQAHVSTTAAEGGWR